MNQQKEHISITASAPGAITVDNEVFKLVSFAWNEEDAKVYSWAYNQAGYSTHIRKAEGDGYAVYAYWKYVNQGGEYPF
jgi:hypothetical protein